MATEREKFSIKHSEHNCSVHKLFLSNYFLRFNFNPQAVFQTMFRFFVLSSTERRRHYFESASTAFEERTPNAPIIMVSMIAITAAINNRTCRKKERTIHNTSCDDKCDLITNQDCSAVNVDNLSNSILSWKSDTKSV